MAESNTTVLGVAQIPIRATLDQLDKDLSQARGHVESHIGRIVKGVQGLGTAALTGLGVVAGAAGAAAAALASITIDASQVEGLAMAFDGLAQSSGYSSAEVLAALEAASAGMISQRDLMKSYNQAAQLVGLTFANRLPEAMQYLSKVSAATGQDMGFLLDSLVRGVGRLSPMILDNLAVQVSLAEATERATEMYGKEADQLSKAEIQAGMMDVTLQKLAENTASMPDIADKAAGGLARFKAQVQNAKDSIGMVFLPTLNSLMGTFNNILNRVMPPLTTFMESTLAPVFEKVARFAELFFMALDDGMGPVQSMEGALRLLGLTDLANVIHDIKTAAVDLWEKIGPIVSSVVEWIGENIELQDVLIALGVAIASVVVPALWSAISAAAPIIAAFVALVGVAALIRQAWESDFLGIRTAVVGAFEEIKAWVEENWPIIRDTVLEVVDQVKAWVEENWPIVRDTFLEVVETIKAWVEENWPIIREAIMTVFEEVKAWVEENWPIIRETILEVVEEIKAWFEENWPVIESTVSTAMSNMQATIETLATVWQEVLLPAITSVVNFFLENLVPVWVAIADMAVNLVGAAITALTAYWNEILYPVLVMVWGFIQENIVPLFQAVANLASAVLGKAIEALAGLWQNVLQPAMLAVYKYVQENIIPVFNNIATVIEGTVGPILSNLADKVLPPIKTGFEGIGKAIQSVIGWINDLAEKISNIELPEALTPGSPTPFEIGLRGIADALREVQQESARAFAPLQAFEIGTGGQLVTDLQANETGPAYQDGRQFNVYLDTTEPEETVPAIGSLAAMWGFS